MSAIENTEDNVIGSKTPRKSTKKSSSLKSDENSVIGSSAPKKKATTAQVTSEPINETVAIFSERNVTWQDVGRIQKGYNIVSKSSAEKWLTRPYIREASPEEIAREFGV